jgi:putative transcriptional regulator
MEKDRMTAHQKPYKSDALRSVHLTARDLHSVGAIDKATMREFDVACLTHTRPLEPEEIRHIREEAQMSQSVFAMVLNVTTSLISQWERGEKKPSGPSLKLLALAHRKGIEAIL